MFTDILSCRPEALRAWNGGGSPVYQAEGSEMERRASHFVGERHRRAIDAQLACYPLLRPAAPGQGCDYSTAGFGNPALRSRKR